MEYFVYSRRAIERIEAHEVPHVILSITSSVEDRARLPIAETTLGVLRLTFPDLLPRHRLARGRALFSEEQADRIWAFVTEHRAACQRIVLHCDAGVSRSPAVAAALAKVLGDDDRDLFERYDPNPHVYRLLLSRAPRASELCSG